MWKQEKEMYGKKKSGNNKNKIKTRTRTNLRRAHNPK